MSACFWLSSRGAVRGRRGDPVAHVGFRTLRDCFVTVLLAMTTAATHAQEPYPTRNVRVIVPFSPGTGIDILARTLGAKLGERWKTSVIVDNRPGASGNIGTEAVAKAAPDGYTLLMTASTIVTNRGFFKTMPYDAVKDFAPVMPLARGSLAFVTHPSLPVRSVREFVSLAKARPGEINYASPGNGTPHHLATELFKLRTGIDVKHIPYKATGPAVADILGGHVSVMFLPIHVALPHAHAKKLRLLAAGGSRRAAATPNVPSLAEAAGIRDIDVDIWYALYAPAGTAAPVVTRLNADIAALLREGDTSETLAKQGLTPTGGTPDDLARLTRTDLERWLKVVREARIQPD
jgi:tripartite-type tricarboxylate transporter receptor subunit TctC